MNAEVRSRLQKARVLIISPDHLTAVRIQEAFAGECLSTVRPDPKDLTHGFAFDLVVLAAYFSAVDELAGLDVPAILLPTADTLARAQRLAAGKRAVVLPLPHDDAALLACVHALVGAYVEPW